MGLRQAAIKLLCRLPIRGRHRLIARFGGGGVEPLRIGKITIPLDLSIEFQRYAYYGLYESHVVAHLRRIARPGDVVIDPGSNIGYIAAVAADLVGPKGKVIALEPSRTCYEPMVDYLRAPNVELLMAALHNHSGRATFYDTPAC